MLSPEEVAMIEAEIERLEKARKAFPDGSVQTMIDEWNDEQKRKLIQDKNSGIMPLTNPELQDSEPKFPVC
jgi:hypothetical protein